MSTPTAASSPPQKHLLLVLHGKAAADAGVRKAVQSIQAESAGAVQIAVRPTYAAGDAQAIVRAELAAAKVGARPPVDVVVAGGGDGTLCEVMAALLEHQNGKSVKETPSVASLLMGTANDLGSACGVSADPAEALRLAADPSRARPVDVAFCNDAPFCNVATAGPISAVSSSGMSETLKRLLGPLSVPVAGAMTLLSPAGRHALRPQPVTLVFPTASDVPEPPLPPGLRLGAGGGGGASGSGRGGGHAANAVAASAAAAVAAAASSAVEKEETAAGGGVASPPKKEEEEQQQQKQQQQQEKDAGVVVMPAPQGAAGAAVAGKVMAVRGALVALAVGQARQMGRFINITPAALLDDGLLDVTALFAPSIGEAAADLARDALAAVAEAAAAGVASGGGAAGAEERAAAAAAAAAPLPLAGLCTLRVPWLHVYLEDGANTARGSLGAAASDAATAAGAVAAAAPPPAAAAGSGIVEAPPAPLLYANCDGEPLPGACGLRFHLLPRAVRMHLPAACPLLVAGAADAAAAAAEGRGAGGTVGKKEKEELEAAAQAVAIEFAGAAEARPRGRSHAAAVARLSRRLSAPLSLLRQGGRPGPATSRAHLLRALLRAQQPPGRLARALPVILARLGALARALLLVLLGAALAALALGRGG